MLFSSLVTFIAVFASVVRSGNSAAVVNDGEVVKPLLGFGAQRISKGRLHHGAMLKQATSCENVDQYWYTEAVVDNFAPVEEQQFWAAPGQRYWLNRQFWGGAGFPIFVYIGGEGEESCSRLTNHMYAYDLAQEHRALLVDVEHRFYGESYPTEDMSTRNLKYLSSEQALADLARIIDYVKTKMNSPNSKVITIGGSYPGDLSAWFRLKYPASTQGSIASSAPVIARSNFAEYMEVVGQSIIHFSGQSCYDALETAAEAVAKLASSGVGSEGMMQLEKDFQTCGAIGSELDLGVLLSDLMGNIQGTIQYNNEHNGVMNVTDICTVMTQSSDAYQNFVSLQAEYRQANGQTCEDASWKDTIAILSSAEKDPANNMRPWIYQSCNEFGFFQTTDSENQPFHSWKWLGMNFYEGMCREAYNGWKSDPNTHWTNTQYGNVNIAGTNIVFPSGTIDPWHALGVTNYTALPQSSEHAVFIEGTAHCNDLYAPASSDPESLVNARKYIADQVAKWLQ